MYNDTPCPYLYQTLNKRYLFTCPIRKSLQHTKTMQKEFSTPRTLNISIKMNSPELPIASRDKVTSRVHHQDVVADNEVSLLPSVVVCNPPIVKSGVNGFANFSTAGFIMVINAD